MKLPVVWILSVICLTIFAKSTAEEPRVVCYYTNWSIYRPGNAKYSPQNINPYLCTHLIYAFGGFTKDNTLQPFDKYQDIEKGGYAKFTGLKTYNKNLKTMLAIGGWNEASSRFSPLVGDAERRRIFVKNTIKYLRQNHFDGLDLDWEYPTFRDGGKMKDRVNYAQFVQELREEFDRESSKTGRTRLLLTLAIPAGVDKIEQGYDVVKLNQYLDWFNLLTYDYHDSFEPATNHHAPLYSLEEDDEYNYDGELNIDFSVKYLINAGADRQKLVLGIPTYGRSYTLFNPDATDIGAPTDGPGDPGDATREKGFLAYYEICQNIKSDDEWTVMHPNDNVMGPYLYKDDQWISYDDEKMARKKAQYAAKNGLGGIMFWSIDTDDFRGTCSGKPYPLIEAAKEGLYDALGIKSTDSKEVIVKTTPRNRKRPTRPTKKPVVSNEASNSLKDTFNRRQKPSETTRAPTTESSIVYNKRTTTPEPPTTPDPGSDFKCEDEGFFSHPRDCKKYFWCLDSGPANLGIVAHQFTCPSGLVFNKQADSCDYARNVICEKTKPSTTTTGTPPTTTSKTTTKLSTTQRTTTFRTTTSRPTTTSTTTPAYDDDDEEYEDEIEDSEYERDIEDPKVIKELIDLIKKAGGLDKLEKHLKFSNDNSPLFDNTKPDKLSTTQATFSKSLYDKVLLRKPENRFVKNENTNKIKSDREVINVTPKVNNTRYSSVYRNSRPSPQNAGLENLSDFEGVLKEKPQYVTIQRNRTTIKINQDSGEDDTSLDDSEQEYSSADTTTKSVYRTTAQPQYVNIQRNRVTTESTDVDESDFDEFVLNPYSRPIESVTQSSFYSTINRGGNTNHGASSEISSASESPIQYSTINRRPKPDSAETVSISDTKSTQYTTINRETKLGSPNTVEIALNSERGSTQYATINRGRRPDNSNSEETTTTPDIETTTQYATISSETKSIKSENSEKTSTQYNTINRETKLDSPNTVEIALNLERGSTQYAAINRGRRPDNSNSEETTTTPDIETTTQYATISSERKSIKSETSEKTSTSDADSIQQRPRFNPNRRRRPENSGVTEIPAIFETERQTQHRPNIRRRRPDNSKKIEISSPSDTESTTEYSTINRRRRPNQTETAKISLVSEKDSTAKTAEVSSSVNTRTQTRYQTFSRGATTAHPSEDAQAEVKISSQTSSTDKYSSSREEDVDAPDKRVFPVVINSNTKYQTITRNQIKTTLLETTLPTIADDIIIPQNNTTDLLAENAIQKETSPPPTPATHVINQYSFGINLNNTNNELTTKQNQLDHKLTNPTNTINISANQINTDTTYTLQSHQSPNIIQNDLNDVQAKTIENVTEFITTKLSSPRPFGFQKPSKTILLNQTHDAPKVSQVENLEQNKTISYPINYLQTNLGKNATKQESEIKPLVDRTRFRFTSYTSPNTIIDFEESTTTSEITQSNLDGDLLGKQEFKISSSTGSNVSKQTAFKSRDSATNFKLNDAAGQDAKTQSYSDSREFRISSSTSLNSNEDDEKSTTNSNQVSLKSRNATRNLNSNEITQEANIELSADRRGFRIASTGNPNELEKTEISHQTVLESENTNTNGIIQEQKIQFSSDRRGFRISSSTSPNSSDDLEQSTTTSETPLKSRNSTTNTNGGAQRGKIHNYSDTREFRISSEISTNSNEYVEQSTISNQTSFKSQNSTINNDATQDEKINSSEGRQGVRISSTSTPNELEQTAISHKSVLESESSKINLEEKVTAHEQNVQSSSDRQGFGISSSTSNNPREDLEQSTIISQSSFKSRNSAVNLNTNDAAQNAKAQASLDRRGFRISSSTSPNSSEDLEQSTITSQTSFKSRNSTTNFNARGSAQGGKIQSNSNTLGFRFSSLTSPNSSENVKQSTISNETSFKSQNSTINLTTNDATQDEKIHSSEDRQGVRISSTSSPNELEQTAVSHKSVLESESFKTNLEGKVTAQEQNVQSSSDRHGFGISSSTSPNPSEDLEQSTITSQTSFKSRNSAVNLNTNDAAQDAKAQASLDRRGFRITSSSSPTSSEDLEQSTISSQISFKSRNSTTNLNANGAAQRGKIHNYSDTREFRISPGISTNSNENVEQSTISNQASFKSQNSTINLTTNDATQDDKIHSSEDRQGVRISSTSSRNELEQTAISHKSVLESESSKTNLEEKVTAQEQNVQSSSDRQGFGISSSTSNNPREDLEQLTISSQSSFKSRNSAVNLNTNDAAQDAKAQASLDRRGFRIAPSISPTSSEDLEQSTISSQISFKSRDSTTSLNARGTAQGGIIQSNSNTLGFRFSSLTSPNASENVKQSTISNQTSFKSQNSTNNLTTNDATQDEKIHSSEDRRGVRISSTSTPNELEQTAISHKSVLESESSKINLEAKVTAQEQNVQSSSDRQGFGISSSTSPNPSEDLEQSTIISQTSFKSRNSAVNLNTNDAAQDAKAQTSLDRRGFRITSSSSPTSSEDFEQSTITSQTSFKSRNATTNLNARGSAQGGKIQSNSNTLGFRFSSLTSPNSSENVIQSTISNETSFKSQNSTINLNTNDATQDEKINSSEDRQGVRISSTSTPNELEQTAISHKSVLESESSKVNLEAKVTAQEQNVQSSSDRHGFGISSSTSPNPSEDLEQSAIISQTSFKSQQISTNDAAQDAKAQASLDRRGFRISPSSSPNSSEDLEQSTISSQISFKSRNSTTNLNARDSAQGGKIQSNSDTLGFSISSLTSTNASENVKQSTISNQTSFKSQNSTSNFNANDVAQDAKIHFSEDRRGNTKFEQNSFSHQTVIESENKTNQDQTIQSSLNLNSKDVEQSTISSQGTAEDEKILDSLDREGIKISSTASPNGLGQTTISNKTSINLGSNEVTNKETKFQSSSENFKQESIFNQTLVKSHNLTTNLGVTSLDGHGLDISSSASPNEVDQVRTSIETLKKTQISITNLDSNAVNQESTTPNLDDDLELTTIYSQTLFESRETTTDFVTTDTVKDVRNESTVNRQGFRISPSTSSRESHNSTASLNTNDITHDAKTQSSFDRRGFRIASSTSPKSITGFEKSSISSQSLIESQNFKENFGSISTTTQATETKPAIHRGRFRVTTPSSLKSTIDAEQATSSRQIEFEPRNTQQTDGEINSNALLNRNVRPTNFDELSSLTSIDFNRRTYNNGSPVVRRRLRPTKVPSTTTQEITPESTGRSRIRQRVRIVPSTTPNSFNDFDGTKDSNTQFSFDRRGNRISSSGRSKSSTDSEQTIQESSYGSLGHNISSSTSPNLNIFETISSQNSTTSLDITDIAQEAKSQSSIDTPQMTISGHSSIGSQKSKVNLGSNDTNEEPEHATSSISNTDLHQRISNLNSSSPDSAQQQTISIQTLFNSQNSTINLNTNDAVQDAKIQTSVDRKGFRISATSSNETKPDTPISSTNLGSNEVTTKETKFQSSSASFEQDSISKQSLVKSLNLTTNLGSISGDGQELSVSSLASPIETDQKTLHKTQILTTNAINQVSTIPNSGEDSELSTIYGQNLLESRNTTTDFGKTANVQAVRNQSTVDRRGFRIVSSTSPKSITGFEKSSISSESLVESHYLKDDLGSSSTTTEETETKPTIHRGRFRVSTPSSPKSTTDAEQATSSRQIEFEPRNTQQTDGEINSNALLNRNVRPTNFDELSSLTSIDFNRRTYNNGSPVVRRRLRPTKVNSTTTQEITPESTGRNRIRQRVRIVPSTTPNSFNAFDGTKDSNTQFSFDRRGNRISSSGRSKSSTDSEQTIQESSYGSLGHNISSSTSPNLNIFETISSQNSTTSLNITDITQEAKSQSSIDTPQMTIFGHSSIESQKSDVNFGLNDTNEEPERISNLDSSSLNSAPQPTISSQTVFKSQNTTINLNSNDAVQDAKMQTSVDRKGFRISTTSSANELDQTTITNETQPETPTSSTNLGSNEVTTKETKFQSSSASFEQDSISKQSLVKSLNFTTNLGSISGDGQELAVSSLASPIETDQKTVHKAQTSGEDSELSTIYGQNLLESRNTTTDFGKTVNVQAVRNQSTVDRRGFRVVSSTSPKSITGFEKSSISSQSLIESQNFKENFGSISTTTQATETKPTIHRGRFRVSTPSSPKSTIDAEQATSSRQIEFEPRNTQQTDGEINSNALLNRNVRPTNFDELSSLTSIDFNRRTYNNGSPVVRRRLRPTKVNSTTTQEITPESTGRSRIRQRFRVVQSTTPNSYNDFDRANDSNTQSSFDRRGNRISSSGSSTSARIDSSTDFEETNLNSEHTNQASSFDSVGLNISSSTNPILSLDIDQKTISSQTSIGSQNSATSLNITETVQELNLGSNNFTEEPEYATISNDDLEKPTFSSLDGSSPDSAQGFEQPTISSQSLFDSRNSTSNSTTSQEARFNSNVDRQGIRISSATSPKSIIEQTTSSNQILFQSRNSTENQRNKVSVDRRRFKVSPSTNRPAIFREPSVNFQQTASSSQILPETKGWVINTNRGTRKFFSRFTTEASEPFTETPYRSNLTRKFRPDYQETEEAVNYNSLLDRNIRPASLDELSSLTAFDFNRKNYNNDRTVIRRRPRPKVVTTTTTTAEEITSAATESSSSTTESSRIYKRPVIPRHRFLSPTSTTTATPAILSDPIEIIDSNSQTDTPSTDPSISLSLSKSYEFGFASRNPNSTVQTVFETDSSRISNINVTTQSQDSTFSDQTNLTMPETEQIFQIDTTTAQIISIAQNSLNVTTENNLSTTNNIVTNSSQHVPLSDSKSSETIKTRSRVRTVKRLRDPVKYIENTIETTGNTESRPAINFSLAANPTTIETVANEGFNFQTTNTTTINSILINETESESEIRSRISTRAPNTEEPTTQTERRRQFQSRISTTPNHTLVTESNSDLAESQEGSGSSNTTKETRYRVVNQTFKRRPGTKLEIISNDTLEENVEAIIERTKSVPKFNARTRRPRPFKKQEISSEETEDVGIVEENLPLVDEELESNTRKNSFIPPRRAFASRTTTTPATVNIQTESQISENITSTSEPKSTSRPRFKVFNRTSTKKPTTQPDVDIEDQANSEEDLVYEEVETSSKITTPTQPRKKFAPRFSATQSKTETESRFSGNKNSVRNNVRTFTRKPIVNASPTDNENNSGENLPVYDEELDTSIPVETTTQARRKFFARPFTAKATVNTQLSNETKTEVSENIDVSRQQNSSLSGRRKFGSRVPTTPISLNTQSVSENINSTKVPRYNLLNRTRKPFAKPVIQTEDDKSEENLPLADEEVDSVTLDTEINLVTDGYTDSAPQGTTLEDENTEDTFTMSTEELKPHTSTTIKPRRVIKVVKGTKRPVIELKLDSIEELDQSSTEENLTSTEGELDQTTQNEPNDDETTKPFPVIEINTQDEENVSSEDSELEFNAQKTSATYAPTTVTTTTTTISTEDVLENITSTNAPRFKVFNRTFTRRPITQPETDDKPKENLPLGNAEVESNSQNGTTIQSSRKYVSRVSTAKTNAETPERPKYKVRAFTRKPTTTRLTTTSNESENYEENISSDNEEVESSSAPGSSVPTRRTLRPRFSTTPSTVSKKVIGEIQVSENITATNASRFKPINRATFTRRPLTKLEINSDGSDDENNSEEKTFVSDESQNITSSSTEYRKYTSRTSTTRSNSETENQVGYKIQTFTRKPVTSEADDGGRDSEENLALDSEEIDASISTTPTIINTNESDEAEIRDSENVTTTFVIRPSAELEINSNGTMHDDNSDENSQFKSISLNDTFELNVTRTSTNQADIETEISVSGNKNLTDISNNGEENLAPENEEEEVVESDTETNFSIPTSRTYVTRISTTPTTVNTRTKEESEKINSTSAPRFKAFNRTFTQRPVIKAELSSNGSNVDDNNSDENSPEGDEDDESNSQIDSSTQSRRLNISRTSSAQTNSETEKRVAGNGYKIRAFTRKPISNEPDNDDIGSEEDLDNEHIESNVQVDTSTSTRRTFTPRASIKSLKVQSNDESEAPVSENINSNKYSLINRTRKPFGQREINLNGSDDGENSEKILDDEDVEPKIQIDAITERRKYVSRITTTPVPPPIKYKVINRPVSKSPFTTPQTISNGSNDDENVEENLHNDEEDEASDEEENTGNVNSPFPKYKTIDRTSTLRPFANVNESDDNENSEGSQTNSETESRVFNAGNAPRYGVINRSRKPFSRPEINSNTPDDDDYNSEENSHVDDEGDEVSVQSGSSGIINSGYKTFGQTNGRKPFPRLQINANEPDNNENEEDTQEFESNSQIDSASQTDTKLRLSVTQTNSETENRVSGNINSFNAPRYGVINRTRKPFTRPETNSNTPDGDNNSEENSEADDEEYGASLQSGNSGAINSETESRVSGNINAGNSLRYGVINQTRKPFTRPEINSNTPDDEEYDDSVESGNIDSAVPRFKPFDRTSTRKPFTRLEINANEHEDNGNTEDSQEFESNSQIDSASQTGNKYVSRLSVTQNRVLGNNNADNAPRYGVVNRTRKPFTRPEINSRTPEGKENSEANSSNNPSIPLRKKFVPRVSNTPTSLNVQSENRVVGNIPKFRTASPRPSPNLDIQTNDEDFDENESSEDGYDSFEENLTGNDEEVNSYSKIDTSTQSIRKFKPNSSNSINSNTPTSTEPSLPAGYRNKAIFQRKPYARPIYSNEPSESDNSEETVTLKSGDDESNTESDLNNDNDLVETTTIQGELISETISKINNNFTQTNNNSEGALWSSLSEQTNSTIYKILGSNIVDYRNESESLVQVNRSNNSPATEKVINKPFSIRTQNNANNVQSTQITGSQNSPVQSIKIDSGKFIPFHLRPKTTFNTPSVQPTTPTIKFSHHEVETTTGSIPNTDYTNIPHSTTLDTSTPIISTLADTNLYSTLISQESTTTFAGEDVEKVTTEISINPIKILKPTTTTSKPTTLHHIFAVDYDSAEEDRNNGTNLGNSTELTDDDSSGNSKEASAEEISLRLEKLVEINRIVEIYSKQQSNGRNDLSANSNELILEQIPTIDKIGEISRWISVKLQNHNTSSSSNKFHEILQNITQLATVNTTGNSTFDSNMIFNVETSTIPLEGLFDKNKKNFTDNEVIDYQVTKAPLPSTPLASMVLPPPPPSPQPLTIIDSNPQNSKSFAGSTSFGIAAATIPSHSYVQQLRPESHEANPLVISIANLDQVVLSKSEKIDKKISFPSIIGSTESSNQLTFSSNSDNQTN